jgi:hypothetical protein
MVVMPANRCAITPSSTPWAVVRAAMVPGVASVLVVPGWTTVTFTPDGPNSSARFLVIAATETLRMDPIVEPVLRAASPLTLIIRPHPRAAGDLRIVALARVRLGRVLRALGRHDAARIQVAAARQWFDAAGGGDGALLADHLAAALNADETALTDVLASARAANDREIEVLTLDRLALVHAEHGHAAPAYELLATADGILPTAQHLVADDDRTDAARTRVLLSSSQ